MTVKNVGTHISHCCAMHGCKYRDEDCPVALNTEEQTQACPYCTSSRTLSVRMEQMEKELEWSKKLEAKGFIVFGDDEDYF